MRIEMAGRKSKSGLLMGLFLLGCVWFNYPILTLFNKRVALFGIPLLYLYLFAVWTVIILAIMLITRVRATTIRPNRSHVTPSTSLDPKH
jgi:hypothetical protein